MYRGVPHYKDTEAVMHFLSVGQHPILGLQLLFQAPLQGDGNVLVRDLSVDIPGKAGALIEF